MSASLADLRERDEALSLILMWPKRPGDDEPMSQFLVLADELVQREIREDGVRLYTVIKRLY